MQNEIIVLVLIVILIIIFMISFSIILYFLNKQNTKVNNLINDIKLKEDIQKVEMNNIITNQLNTFSRQVNDDLIKFNNIISENTTNHLNQIQNGLTNSIHKNFETTEKLINNMTSRITKIDEAQKGLESLSGDINSLQNILKDKKTRGIFGEVELYSILEDAFGINDARWQKQVKLSNGNIADAVLYAPSPLGKIVIDSKFPLENYNRIYNDELDKSIRENAKKLFRNDVIKHIDDISRKYLIEDETAPIAYMFIPAEAIFAEIYGHLSEIVEYSYRKRVYLVSPTTLMAYLTAIKGIYLGQKRDEKVAVIQSEFNKLAQEFDRYKERYEKVYKDFEKTYQDFNRLNTTSEKITRRFDEIHSVKLEDNKVINHEE